MPQVTASNPTIPNNHTQDMLSCHPGFLIDLKNGISTRWWSDPMRSMYVWICYHTVAGVVNVTWTMPDSCDVCHESRIFTSNHTWNMLSCHHCFLFELGNSITTRRGSDPMRGMNMTSHCCGSDVHALLKKIVHSYLVGIVSSCCSIEI